jgi:hypothetical protein
MMNREAEMQEIYRKNGWGTPNVSFGVHPGGTIETLETAALAKPKPRTPPDTSRYIKALGGGYYKLPSLRWLRSLVD